jgi:hypothetical protein
MINQEAGNHLLPPETVPCELGLRMFVLIPLRPHLVPCRPESFNPTHVKLGKGVSGPMRIMYAHSESCGDTRYPILELVYDL